jgi:hypothetical protein
VTMRVVYIAAPLGDGVDRPENIRRASKWVVWCADQGHAPVATWVTLAGEWPETRRDEGLAIDLALIGRCDEVWLCGPRVSKGMHVESDHARRIGKPIHVLVNPLFVDGPPARNSTFDELVMRSPKDLVPDSKVREHLTAMAAHHGYASLEEFTKLSYLQVFALERDNPAPKGKLTPYVRQRIEAVSREHGWDAAEVTKLVLTTTSVPPDDLGRQVVQSVTGTLPAGASLTEKVGGGGGACATCGLAQVGHPDASQGHEFTLGSAGGVGTSGGTS